MPESGRRDVCRDRFQINVALEEGPSGGWQSREEDYPSPPSRWVAVATGVPGSPLAALTAASTILDGHQNHFEIGIRNTNGMSQMLYTLGRNFLCLNN